MSYSITYDNKDFFYIRFKRHYCPKCRAKLKTVVCEKHIERNSPDAENHNFKVSINGNHGTVQRLIYRWREFECPSCSTHYTVKEIQRQEGVYKEP